MSRLLPSVWSWSAAAGRYGSAATNSGRRPCLTTCRASLALEVVLPEPCRPTIATTAGLPDRWKVRSPADRSATSSSLTILTTCWPADRLSSTSWPMARSRTRATKSLTTLKLTSASSSARRTSRIAASTSASVTRPRPVSPARVLRRRSLRVSNMRGRGPLLSVGIRPRGKRPAGGARVLATPRSSECSPRVRDCPRAALVEQGGDEGLGVEREEVLGLLPHADEPDRDAELALDGEHDAALGGRVELREHHAGEADGLVERLRLGEPVLAGRGVEHEERLHLGAGQALVDDAADLGQLVHEVRLRVEAARGVGDQEVGVARDGGVEGVEHDRCRVRVRGVGDDLAVR